MNADKKQISECIAPRGSFTSDKQKYSSYPFAFDRNCPFGVTDMEIINKDNIKVCQPHLPPFQNQYTVHSHFQDLFLKPDCPSCVEQGPNPCNKTSNLNNNPQCLNSDCLIADPEATQFTTIPMPVCFDNNTTYMLPDGKILPSGLNGYSNGSNIIQNSPTLINSLQMAAPIPTVQNSGMGILSTALSWIICVFLILALISLLSR